MKIHENSQMNLTLTGVYKILNQKDGKVYIGSTTQCFEKRFRQHYAELVKNKHKNSYLQNAWNKYGESMFEFSILKICLKKDCFIEEQIYIDMFINKSYNINPLASGTPNLSKETILKRIKTFTKTNQDAMCYYKQLKENKISIEDIPSKYIKLVLSKVNVKIWNKGITKDKQNYDYLKVPKTKTNKYDIGRIAFSKTQRNKSDDVCIYDYKGNFIMSFKSISDIVDYTKNEHTFPLIQRSHINNRSLNFGNIRNVCAGITKHHKGLIFRYKKSELPIIPLIPSDIHFKWKEFKLQSAAFKSDLD